MVKLGINFQINATFKTII